MSGRREPGRRRSARPGGGGALGSLVVHGLVFALVFVSTTLGPPTSDFVSYQIELVAMPEVGGSDLVVEAPTAPAEPEPAPDPVPDPAPRRDPPPAPSPKPEPKPAPKPPEPQPRRAAATPSPATATRPTPEAETQGGDAVSVRIEGLRRDYPRYYENIITQIQRCFRWGGGGTPSTEVSFVINADGTVSDIDYVKRSGNPAFDIEAMGAVECAGQPGRIGALPEDLPYDRLPIRFTFRPGGGSGTFR